VDGINVAVFIFCWSASVGYGREAQEKNFMPRAIPLAEQKLPLSTALLSNVALVLLMWNLALRLALVVGSWASVSL
jgi:hypothetical protein